MFTIDNITFDALVISCKRSFEVSDSESSGRTQDWVMHRDPVGTFYNYSISIDCRDRAKYDQLYELLSAPSASHTFTFPYGQTTISFRGYVTKGSDELIRVRNGVKQWKELSFNCIAMAPYREA